MTTNCFPIETAPKSGDILGWNGTIWVAIRWSGWGGGIWQCSHTGHNLTSTSDAIKWWMPMPSAPSENLDGKNLIVLCQNYHFQRNG